jgi:AraC-like DNA-binding protein
MHREFLPPESLQNSIRCFWYDKRDFGKAQTSFDVMPDGYAEIIFHFGNGCSISNNGKLQPLPSPFMVGLLNQPATFHTKGTLEIIGVRCFPWTVFDLLGLPSGEDEVRVFEHPIAKLQAALTKCVLKNKIEEAIEHLEQYFLNAHSKIAVDSMLFKAGVAMRKANGTIPVKEVAAAAHATARTLERKFKQSSGRTVKDVSGLMRFEQVRNQLWIEPDSNIAGLAHDFGYTDQSHLSREFKRYSGTTPGVFASRVKKERRMVKGDFVAFTREEVR